MSQHISILFQIYYRIIPQTKCVNMAFSIFDTGHFKIYMKYRCYISLIFLIL